MKDMLLNFQKDVDQIKQGPRKIQNRETTEYVTKKFNNNKDKGFIMNCYNCGKSEH